MYFSTRILTPVFQANSKFIALAVVIVKIPFTILTALVAKVCRLSFFGVSSLIPSSESVRNIF